MLGKFAHVRADSLNVAVRELSSPGARLHAGGTDLLGCLRDGVFGAEKVVSISGIRELRGISGTAEGRLRIGAMTTISEIAADERIAARYSALAQAAAEVASPQLRNQGTIGGNICQRPRCWYFRGDFQCAKKGGEMCYAFEGENQYHCIFGGDPCYFVHPSDTAPALVALGARIGIAGPGGRRAVTAESFFVLPGQNLERENVLEANEVVSEIVLPPPDATGEIVSSFRKVRARQAWDFALASAAIALRLAGGRIERARIVLGGVAPAPWRAAGAEAALTGNRLDAGTISAAAQASVEDAEPLEQNGYKVRLVRGLLEEMLTALA